MFILFVLLVIRLFVLLFVVINKNIGIGGPNEIREGRGSETELEEFDALGQYVHGIHF